MSKDFIIFIHAITIISIILVDDNFDNNRMNSQRKKRFRTGILLTYLLTESINLRFPDVERRKSVLRWSSILIVYSVLILI